MDQLLQYLQFDPPPTKGLGHGYEEIDVRDLYVVQQKKKSQGLRSLLRTMRHDRNFRIIVHAAPHFWCLAQADTREEISKVLDWLLSAVPTDGSRDRARPEALLKRFLLQLSLLSVPGANDVPLKQLPVEKLRELSFSIAARPADDPSHKALPAVWSELARREMSQYEERWQRRAGETIPIKIVYEGETVGELEVAASMTVRDLYALVHSQHLVPDAAVCTSLGALSDRLDSLARGQRVVFSLPASAAARASRVSLSGSAIIRSGSSPKLPFVPTPSPNKDGSVPERPRFVPLAAPVVAPSPVVAPPPADVPLPPSEPPTPALSGPPAPPPPPSAPAAPPGEGIPAPPPMPTKGTPLLSHPPMPLRRLPGCIITVPRSGSPKTLWESNADSIRPLPLQPEDWRFGLDNSATESVAPASAGEPLARPETAGLLGVARERNIAVTLKGAAMYGLLDLKEIVNSICYGKFPTDDVKVAMCELLDQVWRRCCICCVFLF